LISLITGDMPLINFPAGSCRGVPTPVAPAYPAAPGRPVTWSPAIKVDCAKVSRRVGPSATSGDVISWYFTTVDIPQFSTVCYKWL
jgi:hypothetical protein